MGHVFLKGSKEGYPHSQNLKNVLSQKGSKVDRKNKSKLEPFEKYNLFRNYVSLRYVIHSPNKFYVTIVYKFIEKFQFVQSMIYY